MNMLSKKPDYQWYVIYTRANGEKKLCSSLQEKKIECYLPLRKVLRYWSEQRKWIEEPWFKGYLFVKASYREFFTILNTPGVVCYVSYGGKAQPIAETQIDSIKTMVQQNDKEVTLTYKNIRKGRKAEVISGSLKGVRGELVEILNEKRILVRIESMNCSLHADLSGNQVRMTDQPAFAFEEKKIAY